MSDYDSSLPIRTQNDGDVVAKIADATVPSQQLAIDASGRITAKLDDGAGNAITSQANGGQQALDVGINVAGVQIDPRDIRALTFATDSVDASGSTVTVSNLPATADTDYGVVGANTLRTAAEIGNATGAADFDAGATGAQTLRTEANQGAPGTAASAWFTKLTDGTDTAAVNADGSLNITDNGGSLTVDGTVAVSNLPTTVDTDYGTVGVSTLRTAAQIGNATGAADFGAGAPGAQTLRVAADIFDATGTAFSVTNPLPVTITDASPGTAINAYNTAAAIAAGASSNHDYTVTALKTLSLNQIEAAGSGKMKIEVQVETGVATGVFNTRFVQFNSTAETNMSIHIDNPVAVAAGVRVRIIRTNKDNQSQDLYSTICGYELP